MKTFLRTAAVTGVAAIALTACGGASSPADSVASGLDARLSDGATFTISLDGDMSKLADAAGDTSSADINSLLAQGQIHGAFEQGTGFALAFGPGDGYVELRFVDQALYARIDVQGLTAAFPDVATMADPSVLAAIPADLQPVAQAALTGQWVGITGLSQDALSQLQSDLGGLTGATPDPSATANMQQLLDDMGLSDGQTFADDYLVVEGDGPTYDVTLKARAFVQALEDAVSKLDSSGTVTGMTGSDLPNPADVPEEVGGFQVTVEDGKATEIRVDLATVAQASGSDTGGLSEGDVALVVGLGDLGNELDTPSDATTISFENLLSGIMGAMFGGGLSG